MSSHQFSRFIYRSSNKVHLFLIQAALFIVLFTNISCTEELLPVPQVEITDTWASGFRLDWQANSGSLQAELSLDEGFNQQILDTIYSELPVDIEGLLSGTTYYLRYKLISGNLNSEFSPPVEVQTLELMVPQNVSITNLTGDEFIVRWEEQKGVSFELEVSLDNSFGTLVTGISQLTTSETSLLIEPLTPLTTYFVRIRSINQGEGSDWRVLNSVTTTDQLFFTFRTNDFIPGGTISGFFSCDGTAPSFNWKNPPEGTVSYAIVMEDIDVPNGFYHWVLFNIPLSITDLPQGSTLSNKPGGSSEGINDLGSLGYFGPCPPAGESHRYFFTLYALDNIFSFAGSVDGEEFISEIEASILAKAFLLARFE